MIPNVGSPRSLKRLVLRCTIQLRNVQRMVRDDNSRFRIITWPSEPLPHPPQNSRRIPYRLTDGGMIVANWKADPLPPSPRWSEESYLDLVAIDLDDPLAILEFVSVYGPLGTRSGRAAHSSPLRLAGLVYLDASAAIAESLSADHLEVAKADGLHVGEGETLDEFRWGALCLRDLVSAWQVIRKEIDADTHRWEAPVWGVAESPRDELPWESATGAVTVLTAGLATGIECFTPVIRSGWEEKFPVFDDHWVYEICCLELFNHIVEEAPYKHCANEACGRLFVRQRGRAVHGQHRTRGVKYCSSECARAQAQRAYRRRQARA